ncbi:hypothetical protein GAB14E_3237 [Colwellia psychrerythraea]|uniref:Uncharacterized protein n=1 Tax=Colwellia psychrerythraea TaxID=28229 RepID=A0A099KNE8_COLPS|nr:hypothetical protein GAB14E_3237 [Colwellia psychrerythraea]
MGFVHFVYHLSQVLFARYWGVGTGKDILLQVVEDDIQKEFPSLKYSINENNATLLNQRGFTDGN